MASAPHRVRVQAHVAAEGAVGGRGDFGGLDFAAAAPKDVGVADGDAESL